MCKKRRRMRDAPRSGKWPHVWVGEDELQDLKDVHWKALMVLDKLHTRDRRPREKAIADYAREASKGAAGSLHRLTKPRPVWCQGMRRKERRPTRVMPQIWQ